MGGNALDLHLDEHLADGADNCLPFRLSGYAEVGMNASVAFNMFMKATLNAGELPFRVSRAKPRIDDASFFGGANLARLNHSKAQAEAGRLSEHETITADD